MLRLKIDVSGKEASYRSNSRHYVNGLSNLGLYRGLPEKVPSLDQLKQALDLYEETYESAVNGDRVQITRRKKARKELTEKLKKALHYLQSVAEEDDVPTLLQAGFELSKSTARRKAVVAPVT